MFTTARPPRVRTIWARPDRRRKRYGDGSGTIPGAILGRLPGSATKQVDDGLPDLPPDTNGDRARRRLGPDLGLVRGPVLHRGCRRPADRRAAADDPVPAQIPQVVVRLEPGAATVQQPSRDLPSADGRHLPVDRRAPVGA